jgi:hypothetical protein
LWFNFFMCIAFDVAVIAVDALIPMPLVWTLGEAVALVGWTIVFGWLVWRAS